MVAHAGSNDWSILGANQRNDGALTSVFTFLGQDSDSQMHRFRPTRHRYWLTNTLYRPGGLGTNFGAKLQNKAKKHSYKSSLFTNVTSLCRIFAAVISLITACIAWISRAIIQITLFVWMKKKHSFPHQCGDYLAKVQSTRAIQADFSGPNTHFPFSQAEWFRFAPEMFDRWPIFASFCCKLKAMHFKNPSSSALGFVVSPTPMSASHAALQFGLLWMCCLKPLEEATFLPQYLQWNGMISNQIWWLRQNATQLLICGLLFGETNQKSGKR